MRTTLSWSPAHGLNRIVASSLDYEGDLLLCDMHFYALDEDPNYTVVKFKYFDNDYRSYIKMKYNTTTLYQPTMWDMDMVSIVVHMPVKARWFK
jgi:hypothetical protein